MIFLDIWQSYRSLPLWVQIWVFGILVPVNSAAIFFVFQPSGLWVALLAIGAMLPNIPIMLYERGLHHISLDTLASRRHFAGV